MKSRYQVTGMWCRDKEIGSFMIQSADIIDKETGRKYVEGAFRVVRMSDGKPAKVGKGGTVPFYGESAWSDAERLARDLSFDERWGADGSSWRS